MGLKEKFRNWYTKPREGTFWDFGRWMYEEKKAFKVMFIYSHFASIFIFTILFVVFIYFGLNSFFIFMVGLMDAVAIYKGVKLYRMYKSGLLKQFTDSYSVKDFHGGKKNDPKGKISKQKYGTSKTDERQLSECSENPERNHSESERASKSISFGVLITEESSRTQQPRDTDTLDPDGN